MKSIKFTGQWWRFFTPMFLHVGIIHLVFNLWFQVFTAAPMERYIGISRILSQRKGTIKMGILYILSGIGGNLASAIFLPHLLSVGASGTHLS